MRGKKTLPLHTTLTLPDTGEGLELIICLSVTACVCVCVSAVSIKSGRSSDNWVSPAFERDASTAGAKTGRCELVL